MKEKDFKQKFPVSQLPPPPKRDVVKAMKEKELTELANNEEFQDLVRATEVGNRFQFNDRYFQIVSYPEHGPLCRGCIFFELNELDGCMHVPCVKNGIDINIKEISETEYKWIEIAINQLKSIIDEKDEYHIIFDNQNMVEQHDFGIDKELRKKICKVMIDHYNK